MALSDEDLRLLNKLEKELADDEVAGYFPPPRLRSGRERLVHDLIVLVALLSALLCLDVEAFAASLAVLAFGVFVLLIRVHRFPLRRKH
jgi:hypothetical protein